MAPVGGRGASLCDTSAPGIQGEAWSSGAQPGLHERRTGALEFCHGQGTPKTSQLRTSRGETQASEFLIPR